MAIEFFTDALLNPYIEEQSPAEVNWHAIAFDGNVMTIQPNGQALYGGKTYEGWVRYAGNVPYFPKFVEVVFGCDVWAYIGIDVYLYRYGQPIVAETIVASNESGIPYPEYPSGGGPFKFHWEPRWFWDHVDEQFDGTYESYSEHSGFLVVTIKPRSSLNPTITVQLGEYEAPPEPGLFWTGYVKTKEKIEA